MNTQPDNLTASNALHDPADDARSCAADADTAFDRRPISGPNGHGLVRPDAGDRMT